MMKAIGIIPARGGSKSIPLKNIVHLHGKPLIAYTIETAIASHCLAEVVVSTDHEAIAAVAEDYGARVIIRPASLATDEAPTELALIHAVETFAAEQGRLPDMVLTLEPTSPFREVETIRRCVDMLNRTEADSVIGVVETLGCYGRIVGDRFEHLFPNQPRRRQDRAPLYRESSTIYGTITETLFEKRSVLGDRLRPLVVSEEEAIDINTPFDLMLAECLMRVKYGSPLKP